MTMQALLLEAVEQRLLRHLDVQFAMMVAGEEPAVMLAAAILSKDAGEGHVCLPLSRLAVDEKMPPALQSCFALLGEAVDWQAILLRSPAVSATDTGTPLILTGERLYLNRLWRNELTVARFFSETNAPLPCDGGRRGVNAADLGDFGRPGHRENNDGCKTACRADSVIR